MPAYTRRAGAGVTISSDKERYPYGDEELEGFIEAVRSLAERVYRRCPKVDVVAEDPADNVILGCGLRAKADYIVSRIFISWHSKSSGGSGSSDRTSSWISSVAEPCR